MPGLDDFFRELDRAWSGSSTKPIPLHLIGSTALMLQARYSRGTKESDLLETMTLTPEVQRQLMTLACDARGSKLPEIVENLHRVERDMIGVEETEIELPSWI